MGILPGFIGVAAPLVGRSGTLTSYDLDSEGMGAVPRAGNVIRGTGTEAATTLTGCRCIADAEGPFGRAGSGVIAALAVKEAPLPGDALRLRMVVGGVFRCETDPRHSREVCTVRGWRGELVMSPLLLFMAELLTQACAPFSATQRLTAAATAALWGAGAETLPEDCRLVGRSFGTFAGLCASDVARQMRVTSASSAGPVETLESRMAAVGVPKPEELLDGTSTVLAPLAITTLVAERGLSGICLMS
mmetsp:Transcript_35825/g.65727  ORF Transcript_35825/g.65727 Transcript_35825/m.65727 type:complete len:247 (+) Transcript_35825:227-967(+)